MVLSLLICLAFLIADRWLILYQFGFKYVDDDQAIMWTGAAEMAKGRFHEPSFYGQRYNSMLEGLLAVPFLWAGVRPNVALPLITSLLTLFPFILLAVLLVRERSFAQAAIVLAFPVTLSPEFGMVSSIPRGFVTGVFLASFAVLPLFSRAPMVMFCAPFFAILALFANPNAALLLFPAGLLIIWKNRNDRRMYPLAAAGALPAAILYYLGRRFYDVRPNYIAHPDLDLSFDPSNFHWADLQFLDDLSPVFWGKGFLVPVIILLLIGWLVRKDQLSVAIALLAGLVLLVVSFGLNKVHHGTFNVFFPWSRMFLAIPFLLVLFISQAKMRDSGRVMWSMPILAAGFFGYKAFVQQAAVDRQVDPRIDTKVEMATVTVIEQHCMGIRRVAEENNADLLVINWGRYKHLINYGCPCLVADFPTTIEPALDRRTWHMRDLATQVFPNVLLTGMDELHFLQLPHPTPKVDRVGSAPLLFLVRNNKMELRPLLDTLGLGMREI